MGNTFLENTFAQDILKGLSSYPKYLPSKYFYDAKGDALFQKIMQLPEYYLTKAEFEIFERQKENIVNAFSSRTGKFHLIELGAGDGYKTKVLLEHLLGKQSNFEYVPVDISGNVLNLLQNDLKTSMPNLEVSPIVGDYFYALEKISEQDHDRKVVLFLGSNIGNFNQKNANGFIKHLSQELNEGDLLLTGVDLKKNPKVILSAYNDASGVTKAFNFNLLDRINKELGANFILDNYMHHPTYDPQSGECRSYLLSLKKQEVHFADLETTIEFEAYESIHTEISKKYALRELQDMAKGAGFTVIENFIDSKGYFVDTLWEKL